jgi:small-conductance mechanosensitive channel
VRDFLTGLFMLIEDQYGVGDVIDTGDAIGTVEGVSLRTTRLRDFDGVVWHVPNGEIKRVGNQSQQWARALVDIPVAYDTDVAIATNVIKRVADELWHDPDYAGLILAEPEVWGVEELAGDRLVLRLMAKTQPSEQWRVSRELRARIKAAFDDAGIEVPKA